MAELLAKQRQEKEPLIHCGVYLDIAAADTEKLRTARDTVSAQLVRSRMGADPLLLRQREGFLSSNLAGGSQLANFAERVLPARSVANLYPMNYSGKTDPKGFFIGRDRFGSNIIVDFDRRAADKTNASALILGNTGQGKSYLLKLLLCNVREAGKNVISLDSEHEMEDECRALGGCFLDYLSGQYRINLLEPRCWDDGSGPEDPDAPDAFRGTLLSQHISFLRDVFRVYKGFDTPHIDTLELMVEQLYQKWNITDHTDFASTRPEDYPILSDLYDTIQDAYDNYDAAGLYPREMLRDLLLGLHSMCRGADARFFNGHTNIDRSKFLVFCVKGLDNMAENLRNTLLFSLLSYMSDQLLTLGNSVAAIDELYLWLSDPTVITYIRNALKRVRKKESALFLASQNLEDFTQPGIRELTRPLFSMLSTVAIVIGAAVFAAPIRASGAAQVLFGKVEEIAKTPGRFAAACYIIHPIFQLVAVTYYVTYPVMGSFCAPVYDKFGLSRANLTRTFEDSGTVIAPLIPWGMASSYITAQLGVVPSEYWQYMPMCYMCIVFGIILSLTGIGVKKADGTYVRPILWQKKSAKAAK